MSLSRYLDLFLAESREHLADAHEILTQLQDRPTEPELWREFMRHAHSMKGMAAAMGFRSMVSLTHAAEELAERLLDSAESDARRYFPMLGESLDCLGGILDRITDGKDDSCPSAEELGLALQDLEKDDSQFHPPLQTPGSLVDRPASETDFGPTRWCIELDLKRRSAVSAEWTVSIIGRIARLGRVVESSPPRAGERLRLVLSSERPRELLERELDELVGREGFTLDESSCRITGRAGKPPTTRWIRVPADQVDALFEGLLELRQEQGRLQALLPDASGPVRQQLQRSKFRWKEVYGALMELRLVPFRAAADRLRQCVRELARDLGKDVHFEILDSHVRLDRRVLDALIDPLMHALRNALDHGIESDEERRSMRKPPRGTLRLSVTRRGERVRITLNDDGRGMRPDDLRRTAVKLGLLKEEETAALTDNEALMLTTLPRFTTRDQADHVSGRGVGLDVVRDSLVALGGRLQIRSNPGQGTELRLWVPLSHALIQTLLVRSAGELYAVPIDSVLKTIGLGDPAATGETLPERIETDEGSLRLVRLSDRLHPQRPAPALSRHACALVLAKVDSDIALVVDEVIGRKDLVIQSFSAPLRGLREYSGGAVLENGKIALVLDALYVSRPAELRKGTS